MPGRFDSSLIPSFDRTPEEEEDRLWRERELAGLAPKRVKLPPAFGADIGSELDRAMEGGVNLSAYMGASKVPTPWSILEQAKDVAVNQALQVPGTLMGSAEKYLAAPDRVVPGAVISAIDNPTEPSKWVDGMARSVTMEDPKYGKDLLEKLGVEPGWKSTLGGLGVDLVTGAPWFKALGSLGALTKAGQASKSAPAFRSLQGLKAEEQAIQAGLQTARTPQLKQALNASLKPIQEGIAKQTAPEGFVEGLSRRAWNLIGDSRMSMAEKMAVLKDRAAKGLPVELADGLAAQAEAGQRSLFRFPGGFHPTSAIDPGAFEMIEQALDAGRKVAATGPVRGAIAAVHDTSGRLGPKGGPSPQDVSDMHRYTKNALTQELVGQELARVKRQAFEAGATPGELQEAFLLREMPFREQRLLQDNNEKLQLVFKNLDEAGIRNARDFENMSDGLEKVTEKLSNPHLSLTDIEKLVKRKTELETALADYKISPLHSDALGYMEGIEKVLKHSGTVTAEEKLSLFYTAKQLDTLRREREPIIMILNSGKGTRMEATRPEVEELARAFGEVNDLALEQEMKRGMPTEYIAGVEQHYMPHPTTDEFDEWVAAQDPVAQLVNKSLAISPEHRFQQPREVRGLSAAYLNKMQKEGRLKKWRGIDLAGFKGKLLEESPEVAVGKRALASANAQAADEFVKNAARRLHEPGPGSVDFAAELKREGIPIPKETRKLLETLKPQMPLETARYVTQQISKMTDPNLPKDVENLFRYLTNVWKSGVTQNPGFVTRNELGAITMAWQVGELNRLKPITDAKELMWTAWRHPEELKKLKFWSKSHGKELTGQELLNLATKNGAYGPDVRYGAQELNAPENQREILGGLFLDPRDVTYPKLDPLRNKGKLGNAAARAIEIGTETLRQTPFIGDKRATARLSRTLGTAGDNHMKLSVFLHHLLYEGHGEKEAAKKAIDALFDYGRRTDFHRDVGQLVFPFATWMVKNFAAQTKTLARRPHTVGAQAAIANAVASSYPKMTGGQRQDAFGMRGNKGAPIPGPNVAGQTPEGEPEDQRHVWQAEAYNPFVDFEGYMPTEASLKGIWEGPIAKLAEQSLPVTEIPMAISKNWDRFRNQPIDKMKSKLDKQGLQSLADLIPPEETTFLGLRMPKTWRYGAEGSWGPLRRLNTSNPEIPGVGPLFGKRGELPAFAPLLPEFVQPFLGKRLEYDRPASMRLLQELGFPKSTPVDTEIGQGFNERITGRVIPDMRYNTRSYLQRGQDQAARNLAILAQLLLDEDFRAHLRMDWGGIIPDRITEEYRRRLKGDKWVPGENVYDNIPGGRK